MSQIVNHTTGNPIRLPRLLALFTSIAAPGNPLIGSNGIRGSWSSPPTDAELRTVGHSHVVETAQPTPGEGEQVRAGPIELSADAWRRTWIVEPIPVVVPEMVLRHHIPRVMSPAQRRAVAAHFAGLPETDPMRADWQAMTEVYRDDAVVESLRVALNRTHAQIDALFVAAGAQRVRT